MRTIWKYDVPVTDKVVLEVPDGAKFLPFVADQHGTNGRVLQLWAEVDTRRAETHPMEKVSIYVVGTGNPMPDEVGNHGYLGSVVSGPFVWHVYRGEW